MWFFFKGQEMPLQYFKSFKLCLKNVSLNSQKTYQNLGTHCDCSVLEFYHYWKVDCKRNADAPLFLISCNLHKVNVAQVPHFPQNMENLETIQFQIFLWSTLQVTHSRQIRISLWGPFMMNMFKMQRTDHVPLKPPIVCVKERERGVKGRGRFLIQIKE